MTRVQIHSVAFAVVIALCMTTIGPMFAQEKTNLIGLPWKAGATGGAVMLCGGGELSDEIYDEFVRMAGGRKARIILIPSAHPYDSLEQMMERFSIWNRYDILSFDFLDTDDPEEANDADFVAPLERATGVWIAGGAQSRLLDRYQGRKVESALKRVVDRGGIVAGFSAGASVLTCVSVKGGTPSEATLVKGFGLINQAVVDTHFSQRARHTRMLKILDENPELIGIGVDETSALIICQDRFRALGDAKITIAISRGENRATVIYRLRNGEEADLTLVGSPFGTGSPTLELLPRLKPRELLPKSMLQQANDVK